MLGALPPPILLDIAILFTALAWGIGIYLVDKKIYIFAPLAVGCFVCLFGYSVESLGAPPLGGSRRPGAARFPASLVRLERVAKNVDGVRGDLGNLHRVPHPAQRTTPLRFPDSRLETARLRPERSGRGPNPDGSCD
jgi:hypothetical protein